VPLKTLGTMFCVLTLAVSVGGCGKKEEEAKYARPSQGCKCAEKHAGAKCQCNHCMGEKAQGKNALCYCDMDGCGCGIAMTKCACDHCQGELDGPTCGCKDKKK
jgi:hypothetical protein